MHNASRDHIRFRLLVHLIGGDDVVNFTRPKVYCQCLIVSHMSVKL
jgi:hypothetical protein